MNEAPLKQVFDFTMLWPNFSSITFSLPETAEQLSALFVVILFVLFSCFLIKSIFSYLKARTKRKFLSELLQYETPHSVTSNRQGFIEKTEKVTHSAGHLWLEFDKTLLEIGEGEDCQLHSTLEAQHFFNSSTLAAGITESRMLAAVPGFLTAVGVIGTFVGLQLGLSGLNLGNNADIAVMKEGIGIVISGAKTAFLTSVWGVFLSVFFNFIEKGLEGQTRSKIHELQTQIDELFPRLNPDSLFLNIEKDGKESRETLQGLAEKIGEKMQESLLHVSEVMQKAIQDGIEGVMTGPMEDTANKSQEALESLIKKFLKEFGKLGGEQAQAMNLASQELTEAIQSLNSSMTQFLENLDRSQSNASKERKIEAEEARKSTEGWLEDVKGVLGTQLKDSSTLVLQIQQLQSSIDQSVKSNMSSSVHLKASANELKTASQEMKVFGIQIKNVGKGLSDSLINAVDSTSNLAHQNQTSSELIKKQRVQLLEHQEQFAQTVVQLQSLIQSADSTFGKMQGHQNKFLSDLKENVSELSKQMTQLLTDYAEQANSQTTQHLAEWSKGTTNYATQMNSAVQALSNVVDEIEDKTSSSRR